MKKLSIVLLVFLILIFSIHLTSAAQLAIDHNQNYTAILTYGQTPYQTGFLSKSNITGWTWWDTNDSIQDRKQQNIIFVNILQNGTPTPITGLSPPSWVRTDEIKNSGTYSYKADYDDQGNYSNNMDMWHFLDDHSTYAPPWEDIDLLNSTAADLSFYTYYKIEDNRDYGYVKISTDRGKTWTQLAEYTGDSGGWIQKTINLDSYAGEEAIIAFNFRSDNKNVEQGWYIDDISVSTTGTGTTSLLSSIWNWITSLVGILSAEILSDGAESPVPKLSVTVEYPTYNHNTSNFSTRLRIIDLVENYQSQGLYYGFFYYENTSDTYTGEYLVKFNQNMPDTSSISVNTSFNTTLWGCQAIGCHDSYNLINDLATNISNTSIHPNGIVSPGVGGDCQSQCHSPYSSQFLTATPAHLHEIRYGHEGGFIVGETGNITIFNVSSPTTITVTMYSESDIIRPRVQTTFNIDSHSEIVDCQDCHTSFIHKNSGTDEHQIGQSETLSGTNISSTGVHANSVTCEECHGNLSYPVIPNNQFSLTGTIGSYDPAFTSYLTNTKTYIINVQNDINISVDIEDPTFGVTLTLIGPIDNTSGLQDLNTGDSWEGTYFVPSIEGSITFKTGSQIFYPLGGLKVSDFTDPSSKGTWIARLFSWSPGSTNFTITSNNPIVEKPIIHIPWNCSECHNPSGTGNASANRTIPAWDNNGLSFAHTDFDDDSKGDVPCRSCHNSFHEISILNCQECHNSPPSGHTNIVDGYNYPYAPYPNCISCHGDPHDIGPGGGANCTDCHLEGGSNTDWSGPILNQTGFFNSVHHNITGDFDASNYSQISKVCWGCHNDYGQQLVDPKHYKIRPDCTDCHADPNSWNSAYLTPPQAVEHQPNGTAITTPNANCTICHNMSLVNGMPPAAKVKNPTPRNFISHYGRQRTDIIVDDGAASNCSYCHIDGGHEFGPVFADPDTASILHGVNCAACHGYGRIHDDVFASADGDVTDRDTYTSNLSTGDITGNVSSSPPYSISGTFNLTWDGSSLELVVVPPSALTSSGMNISEYAGTYYNSSIAWNVSGTGTDILFNETMVLTDTANTTYKFISVDYPEEGEWHCYVVALDADDTNTTLVIEWVHNLFANCTNCHLEGGGFTDRDGSILNRTGFFNSSHYNITGDFDASKYSQISKVCWGCHVDFAQQLVDPGHTKPASELPECEDCHFTDTPLNGDYLRKNPPLQIPEHQPLGEDVQTNISTNCTFCHNNSLSIPIPTTNVNNSVAKNYVSHYVSTTYLMTPTNNTTDCIWCHVDNSNNISWGYPPNPMTSTKFNHTDLNITDNSGCYPCHVSYKALNGSVPLPGFTFHNISMASGAGNDCVYCHDIGGIVREEFQIDVQAMNQSGAIHYDLNRGAADTLDVNNERCWACHGDGDASEADQPLGHPVNFRNPRNCSEKDCHNVNQSILNEPMVYEHFKYVDEIDENLTTSVDCPACHLNSIVNYQDNIIPSDTSLVSHYGSTDDLINTSSCIYCHLDEDNAEEWGNAPDPTSNISRPSDKEWESTLFVGDKWHLGNRYFLTFEDIAVDGDSAFLRLYLGDTLLEELVVDESQNYVYEGDFIDPDGRDVKAIVLEINFTTIFRGNMETWLVKAKASPWKRIHPENNDPACWACHMDDYVIDKKRYLVLDEDEDRIYYVEKLLDFSDDDVRDEETLVPRNLVLTEGYYQRLQVDGGDFILTAEEVDINGKLARITLSRRGTLIEEDIYREGEYLEYEKDLFYDGHRIDDVVIFTARIDSVFHGFDYDVVILTDVRVLSDSLMAVDDDEKLGGFNTSQLHINDTFSIGGAPDTFHVPPLNEGIDGGSDCVYCHDTSNGFDISSVDAIETQLGGHSGLNANATSSVELSDDINKACWACHGDGVEPGRHPANYLYPRLCRDCHADMEEPTYGAVDLNDETHGQVEDCQRCHAADYPGLHVINVFEPGVPYIIRINVMPEVVRSDQFVNVDVAAMAGWNMKVRAIEYFIDVEGLPGAGTQVMPVDGLFDEQVEEAEFTINTTGLGYGNHTIFVHAMERDEQWGPVKSAVFSIESPEPPVEPKQTWWWIVPLFIIIIAVILLLYKKRNTQDDNQ